MTHGKVVFVARESQWLTHWTTRAEEAGWKVATLSPLSPADLAGARFADCDVLVVWLPTAGQFLENALRQLEDDIPRSTLILAASHEVMATTIASWLQHPDRMVGVSPLGLYRTSPVVSLSRSMQLSKEYQQKASDFWQALGLEPLWIADTPGMVHGRIYAMLANEAAFTVQEGVATADDIDLAMRLGTNYPFGPLEWADMVGIDVVLGILESLWQAYRDERYRPCLLLQKLVQAGHCGVRTGRGFYTYPREIPSQSTRANVKGSPRTLVSGAEEKSQV